MLIIILEEHSGKKIHLSVKFNSTIFEIKKIYGKIDCSFIYEGDILEDNKTLRYYDIENGDIIVAKLKQQLRGGEVGAAAKGLGDPTKKGPVKFPITKDGPFYLSVSNGINLFGICKNINCNAYNKEVNSNFGYGTFDLIRDLAPDSHKCPKCPVCEFSLLKLETCGFMKCKYTYEGKKLDGIKQVPVYYSNSISDYDQLDYFEIGKAGENKSLWTELEITAEHL